MTLKLNNVEKNSKQILKYFYILKKYTLNTRIYK